MHDPRPRYSKEMRAWGKMREAEMNERHKQKYDTATGTELQRLQTERNAELKAFWEDSCTMCYVLCLYAWDRSGKNIKAD
jgi:hypothetical protein